MVRRTLLSVAVLAACAGDFDQLLQQGGAYPISDGTSGSTADDPSPASTTADTERSLLLRTDTDNVPLGRAPLDSTLSWS